VNSNLREGVIHEQLGGFRWKAWVWV